MKKLLSLLASTTLVTSASVTAVACGNPKVDENPTPGESGEDLTTLINEFKNDINTIKNEYWKQKNERFFSLTGVNQEIYLLLTKEKITSLVTANEGKPVTSLSETDQISLKSDIEKVIQVDELKSKLYSSIDKEKYLVLINDLEWFSNFSIDWTTLEINYTNEEIPGAEESEGDNFISYIKVDLKFNFTYLDKNGEKTTFESAQKFIFTLTSNEVLIKSIQDLEASVKSDYFLEGGKYSFLDKNNFGLSSDQNLSNIFGNANLNFKNIYESNDFKENIIPFMRENYFSKFTNIPLSFEGQIIFDQFLNTEYLKAENKIEYDVNDFNGKELYNSIFNNITENDKTTILGVEQKEINPQIYAFLKSNYKNFYNSYNQKLNTFVSNLETQSDKKLDDSKKTALSNSVNYGEVKLKGLSINIGSSYKHPINDLSIYISIAVASDETKENREDITKSNLFGAMYYNTIQGIKKYQNIFGIVDRDISADGVGAPIAKFTGQSPDNSDPLDNIWNGIKTNKYDQYLVDLNASLSLTNSSLIKYRDSLLEEGNQKKYNWTMLYNKIWNGEEITYSRLNKSDEGIVLKGVYYAGSDYEHFNFEQNFINVNFKISGIWRTSGSVIIEKANKE